MIVERLELSHFRNYTSAVFGLQPGTTAILGRNGQGKTNLAEALAYLATLDSFRSVPVEALIQMGAETAVIRAFARDDDDRQVLIEAELYRQGRNRVQVNRQKLQRVRDLLGVLRVSIFTPDDLVIIKGGPGERRRFLDDTLVALATKYDAIRLEIDRVLRQRNTLLKNARMSSVSSNQGDLEVSLDVWDARLADLGDRFGHARATLVARLQPMVMESYAELSGQPAVVELGYEPEWRRLGLGPALGAARSDDLRRGVSTVGPHRDDLHVVLNGLPARTHASQGEQRTLALALRLAAHNLVTERTGTAPVLVLDDVLSELDPVRAGALLRSVPDGQVVITSASPLPSTAAVDHTLHIRGGTVVATDYEEEFHAN